MKEEEFDRDNEHARIWCEEELKKQSANWRYHHFMYSLNNRFEYYMSRFRKKKKSISWIIRDKIYSRIKRVIKALIRRFIALLRRFKSIYKK